MNKDWHTKFWFYDVIGETDPDDFLNCRATPTLSLHECGVSSILLQPCPHFQIPRRLLWSLASASSFHKKGGTAIGYAFLAVDG